MKAQDRKRRAKAKRPQNRRGSRRAAQDIVVVDGVPHTNRRTRAIKRAVARIKTPRALRKQMTKYARLKFLEARALAEEEARKKAEGTDAPEDAEENRDQAQV